MKKLFYVIGILFIMTSCVKEEIVPQQPIVQDTSGDTIIIHDNQPNLIGQTWVITKVLNTNFDDEQRSDTLEFVTKDSLTFNGVPKTYNLYPSNVYYTLTLNDTPWGYISGKIYEYNLTQGIIDNCQFKNYFTGDNVVKIWMKKI